MNELDLFAAAIAIADPQERASLLDRECVGRPDMRQRIDQLLDAHFRSHPLLDPPCPEQTGVYAPSEQPGAVIAGRYKLLEQIGEGGMGTVWVAEQTQPVRRKVALKLIKAGMDSRSVIARFEAERQALAVMDHPNVAKVLDGGLTETGRPFFVMEYVKGVPITEYCDATRLSVAERLQLFTQVCQAVQHAHQKGIIHRDLKPSNILVAPYDDKAVPKIIDFGLAKAMHQSLTEKTLHTAHESVLGTPLYMSPEQAQLNNLDVDTRSDIYSLGVLLYELLTGTTPLERKRFKEAAWDEVRRIIREEEPPRPSARLSSTGTLPSLAACRQTEPLKLTRQVRGELDWIVMKALEKDRTRRYDTANGLAKDIQRYLDGDSVEACPPTLRYRLRKAYRRNKTAVRVASAFVCLALSAAVMGAVLTVQAKRAEATAEEKRIEAEANAAKAEANAAKAEENAKEATLFADAYDKELQERAERVVAAEIRGIGLQIDLDLAELRTDPKVGLLRLARPLKHTVGPFHIIMRNATGEMIYDFGKINPAFTELREFVTAAVLAAGQDYAPLLPPISHDGQAIAHVSLSPDNETLLTLGTDHTARLWDARRAKQIAMLRKGNERVVNCGFSPDGRTVFTDDQTSVARFWDAPSGRFRSATEARANRYVLPEDALFSGGGKDAPQASQIGEGRLLTRRYVGKVVGGRFSFAWEGAVELWNTATGRLVAQLDAPDRKIDEFRFLGGRWITAFEGRSTLLVFSAEDGRLLARLKAPDGEIFKPDCVDASPAGDRITTIAEKQGGGVFIRVWDVETGQAQAQTTTPGLGGADAVRYWMDEPTGGGSVVAVERGGGWVAFRVGQNEPIAETPAMFYWPPLLARTGDLAHLGNGWVYDTRTWQRLLPPPGRKFHPDLARFAPDGRFVRAVIDAGTAGVIDTRTDKRLPSDWQPMSGLGWIAADSATIRLLPSKLDFPSDLLELWAQVAVRGELGADGRFEKWDERTWEKKRQELASRKPPHVEFPFPGPVATDKLHWLRQEYESASDKDKPSLAKQLLDRAEAASDMAEAVRWRAIVTPNSPPTKPAASK